MSKQDIRLAVGMVDHHKTVKLIRKCGDGALRCLLRLWCYARENKPDGILSNMDDDDIEIASGWDGKQGLFVSSLRAGWLDGETLHDWEEHQGWACGAKARADHARTAARARWEKRQQTPGNAQAMPEHTGSNAPSPDPSPSPLPNPKPKENGLFKPPTIEEVEERCREKNYASDPNRFWNFYDSNGWKVGKNKMKKWHSALAGWEARNKAEQPTHGDSTGGKMSVAELKQRDRLNNL